MKKKKTIKQVGREINYSRQVFIKAKVSGSCVLIRLYVELCTVLGWFIWCLFNLQFKLLIYHHLKSNLLDCLKPFMLFLLCCNLHFFLKKKILAVMKWFIFLFVVRKSGLIKYFRKKQFFFFCFGLRAVKHDTPDSRTCSQKYEQRLRRHAWYNLTITTFKASSHSDELVVRFLFLK